MPLAVTVRELGPADQPAARAVIEEGLGEHFGFIDRGANPDLDDIAASYARPRGAFIVAEIGSEIVGTAGLLLEPPRARLVRMGVARAHRRAGVATALLEEALRLAAALGIRELVAHTQPEWPDAMAFYRARGFAPCGRDDVDVHLHRPLGAPMIRACTAADAAALTAIYNHYVRETVITFEETPIAVEEMARRIADIGRRYLWLVAEQDGAVVGFAYATEWKTRSAYRFSVETTVYLAPTHLRRGIGVALYEPLIAELKARRLHSAVGGIALPNPASVALHEKLGFQKIGHFVEVGRKFDRWVDVGYWQLLL